MGIYRLICKDEDLVVLEKFFCFQKRAKEVATSFSHENLKWVKNLDKTAILSKDALLREYRIESIILDR